MGEVTATFGLLTVILLGSAQQVSSLAAVYIGVSY